MWKIEEKGQAIWRSLMDKKVMIEVKELSKSFGNKKVIDQLNMVVEEGDTFGFLGPNGSGKTTTIRMMLNLIYPDQGLIRLDGYDIRKDFYKAIEKVGAIVEVPKFHLYLSGRKNLELMANLMHGIPQKRIDEVLEAVGLSDRSDDKMRTYSLGMKQRLGIANALLGYPRLVILDEPTNGLDPQGMKEIRDLICRLASEEKITFFISTHLLHEVEQICNRVAILHHGKIVKEGLVCDLLKVDHEDLEICTSNRQGVFKLLDALPYIEEKRESPRGVYARIEKGYSAVLNRFLVENSMDVQYLIPQGQSLEELFIELTKGED